MLDDDNVAGIRNNTFDAGEFREMLLLRGGAPLRPIRVVGRVNLEGAVFTGGLRFLEATFEDDLIFSNCDIGGDLVFTNCTFNKDVLLDHASIAGSVTFDTCNGKGRSAPMVMVSHARISGDLSLKASDILGFTAAGATIGGDLEILSGRIGVIHGTELPGETARAGIRLDSASISGKVQIGSAAELRLGALSARRLLVEEDLRFVNATAVQVDLSGTHVNGELTIGSASQLRLGPSEPESRDSFIAALRDMSPDAPPDGSSVLVIQNLEINRLEVKGGIILGGIEVGETLGAYGTSCNFMLVAGRIGGDFNFNNGQCGSVLRFQGGANGALGRTWLGGNVLLHNAQVLGQLDFDQIAMEGDVDAIGFRCGSMVSSVDAESVFKVGQIKFVASSFSSYVGFGALDVRGKQHAALEAAAISFDQCKVAGSLSFWRGIVNLGGEYASGPWRSGADTLECIHSTVSGGVSIHECTIDGELDLTGLHLHAAEDTNLGFVLDRSKVKGAVRFRSPESDYSDFEVAAQVRAAAAKLAGRIRSGDEQRSRWQAEADFVSMIELEASEVDLTGVSILPKGGVNDAGGRAGHIFASGVKVARNLRLTTADVRGPDDGAACTKLMGSLRLDEAEIGKLIIGADSFFHNSTVPNLNGVVLSGSRIRTLRVPYLREFNSARHDSNGFPVPLDLSDVDIRTWDFEVGGDVKGGPSRQRTGELATRYLSILSNGHTINRELYRSVVRKLKDEGNVGEAQLVHEAEHRRAFWESRGIWQRRDEPWQTTLPDGAVARFFALAGRYVYQAVVRPVPLYARHLWNNRLWAVFDLPRLALHGLYGRFLAYGASPLALVGAFLLFAAISFLGISPNAANFRGSAAWDWLDAFWVTFRYHVPIIDLFARSAVVPNPDAPLLLFNVPVQGVSAEDWFQAMTILNWVMLPILLAWALRRFVRE